MKRINTVLAITASLCSVIASSQANLVVNGGFEDTAVGANGGTPNGSAFETIGGIYNGTTIGAWNVTAGDVDLIGDYWPAHSGRQSLDLSGYDRGTISQSISLSAGTYNLNFWMSGNQAGPPSTKTVDVSLSGSQQFSSILSANGGNWELKNKTFTINSGGTYVLQFTDISLPGSGTYPYAFGAALDDISLTAVPEPTTMVAGALLLLPFAASTLRMMRRRRSA